MAKRSIVYIDGFNFYYGAVKDTPHKWLNLQKYFELLRQDDDIQKIWYFTAKVSGSQLARQEAYFDALATPTTDRNGIRALQAQKFAMPNK